MIENGSPILVKNTAGTLSFRNQADDADLVMPPVAQGNLISSLTPTFANWAVNPGTAADFADELTTNNLTTSGTGAAGNNTVAYDLGSSKRCIVYANLYNATTTSGFIEVSDDNSNWYTLLYNFSGGTIYEKAAAGKFRYIRLKVIGVMTISQFKLRVYPI